MDEDRGEAGWVVQAKGERAALEKPCIPSRQLIRRVCGIAAARLLVGYELGVDERHRHLVAGV